MNYVSGCKYKVVLFVEYMTRLCKYVCE